MKGEEGDKGESVGRIASERKVALLDSWELIRSVVLEARGWRLAAGGWST